MTPLVALWLPIVVAAVLIFIVSSIIHMALPWHKNDYPAVPDEDRAMTAMRPLALAPGDYMLPRAGSMDVFKTPEFQAKLAQGPVVMMTVLPNGGSDMRGSLIKWFIFTLVVSLLAGYAASIALAPGATYGAVFRVVAVAAFMGYSLAHWPLLIWYRRALGTTVRTTIDGLIYALVTAGAFGWLWPR